MVRPLDEDILGNAELIRLTGEINLLWDEIEMYLWYIFDTLLSVHWLHSYSIYFIHQNHRVRREMVESLAEVTLANNPDRLRALTALFARIKRAARKRNEIAHGIWSHSEGPKHEIRRLPIKRKPPGQVVPYSITDLRRIRDDISKLEKDLFEFSYPEWEKTATRENGRLTATD